MKTPKYYELEDAVWWHQNAPKGCDYYVEDFAMPENSSFAYLNQTTGRYHSNPGMTGPSWPPEAAQRGMIAIHHRPKSFISPAFQGLVFALLLIALVVGSSWLTVKWFESYEQRTKESIKERSE